MDPLNVRQTPTPMLPARREVIRKIAEKELTCTADELLAITGELLVELDRMDGELSASQQEAKHLKIELARALALPWADQTYIGRT